MPVSIIFENLEAGANIDDIYELVFVLRLQPTRSESIARNYPELVASGDDGERSRPVRRKSRHTLRMQGDDDQLLPYKDASLLQAKLLKNSTLKIYPGFPHGLMTTHADVINVDILAFIKGAVKAT